MSRVARLSCFVPLLLLSLAACSHDHGGSSDGGWSGAQPDLSRFTGDPPQAVDNTSEKNAAVLTESAERSAVTLQSTSVFVPLDAKTLLFDYELKVPPGNEEYFDCYVADRSRPAYSAGGKAGIYAGTGQCDVSAHRGEEVALVFGLTSGWGDPSRSSTLTVRRVFFRD